MLLIAQSYKQSKKNGDRQQVVEQEDEEEKDDDDGWEDQPKRRKKKRSVKQNKQIKRLNKSRRHFYVCFRCSFIAFHISVLVRRQVGRTVMDSTAMQRKLSE